MALRKAGLSLTILLFGCSAPNSADRLAKALDKLEAAPHSVETDRLPSKGPNGEDTILRFYNIDDQKALDQLGDEIREKQNPCERVSQIEAITENGMIVSFWVRSHRGGVFRAKCSDGETYLIISMARQIVVAPWKGRIHGN